MQKHLLHLKTIQSLARVPRPLSAAGVAVSSPDTSLKTEDEWVDAGMLGPSSPFVGFDLSGGTYSDLLQGLFSLDGAGTLGVKRCIDDLGFAEEREMKRGRFEEVA